MEPLITERGLQLLPRKVLLTRVRFIKQIVVL